MPRNRNEQVYLSALASTLTRGTRRLVRNGETLAIFAKQIRFNLQENFPILTTKEVLFESVKAELLWFIEGGRLSGHRLSLGRLNEIQGKPIDAKNIWSLNQAEFARLGRAEFFGDCGRIYGAQWRDWKTGDGGSVDQLAKIINQIKHDPFSRYHVINSWRPEELEDMALPPCHMKIQFFVRPSGPNGKMWLDLSMDQRSADMFLGVPFNMASYALLLHMIAQVVDMVPGELVIHLEDCHIYTAGFTDGVLDKNKSHEKSVQEQLRRSPISGPLLRLNPNIKNIDEFTMKDISLVDYTHRGRIPAPLL